MKLPDRAIREMAPTYLDTYAVVRVADEIVIDLMKAACGIAFAEAAPDVEIMEIEGVEIPFASPELLLRMKETYREKDKLDRAFLSELLARRRAT